jgi:hypothetical protein
MISCLACIIERPLSINSFGGCWAHYLSMNSIVLFVNWVLRCQSLKFVIVYNFTNIHAMSYNFDLYACSCRVNIEEPAVGITIPLLFAVSRVGSPRILLITTMSNAKPVHTSLLKVMIPSKHQCCVVCNLRDRTFHILLDAWWCSKNEGSKRPIACNNSRLALSW